MKYLRYLLLILLLSSSSFARPSQNVERTVQLLEAIYEICGSEMGCLLYDPCYVLAFGDLRPEGSWNGRIELASAVLEKANKITKKHGYRILLYHQDLKVQSLRSLALESRNTKFSWAHPPFDISTSWSGWEDWDRKSLRRATREHGKSALEYHTGFLLGYPDLAVEKLSSRTPGGAERTNFVYTRIPYADFLSNGQPNFSIRADDVDNKEILKKCKEWRLFLEAFYSHPKVRKKFQDIEFKRARKKIKKNLTGSHQETWNSNEDLANIIHFQPNYSVYEIDHLDERVLKSSINKLEKLVEQGALPHEWVRFLQAQNFKKNAGAWITAEKVQKWIWYGGRGNIEHRSRFYRAVKKVKPEIFFALSEKHYRKLTEDSTQNEFHRRLSSLSEHPDFRSFLKDLNETKKLELKGLIKEHPKAKDLSQRLQGVLFE